MNPTTVARPETSEGDHDRLRHEGQIGVGGWTNFPQSSHDWMRRVPSFPDVQNHSLAGVSSGRGLMRRGPPPGHRQRPRRGRSRPHGPVAPAPGDIDIDVVVEHRNLMIGRPAAELRGPRWSARSPRPCATPVPDRESAEATKPSTHPGHPSVTPGRPSTPGHPQPRWISSGSKQHDARASHSASRWSARSSPDSSCPRVRMNPVNLFMHP